MRGLNDFIGHTIVGLVWGAWHIPYYLFFLDRAILANFTTLDLAVYITLAIAVMITWAIVYGEIRLMTNSFWPAVLMHMVEDAFLIQLFIGNYIQIMPSFDSFPFPNFSAQLPVTPTASWLQDGARRRCCTRSKR